MTDSKDNTQEPPERLRLPEPNIANLTVLTDKLPNTPILPWNRYDYPWQTSEVKEHEQSDSSK